MMCITSCPACWQLPIYLLLELLPLAFEDTDCSSCCGHSSANIPYPCTASAAIVNPVLFMSWITQPSGSCTLKLSFLFNNVGLLPLLWVTADDSDVGGNDDWLEVGRDCWCCCCCCCCALVIIIKLGVKKTIAIATTVAPVSTIALIDETNNHKDTVITCLQRKKTFRIKIRIMA